MEVTSFEIGFKTKDGFFTCDEMQEILDSASRLSGYSPLALYRSWNLESKLCVIPKALKNHEDIELKVLSNMSGLPVESPISAHIAKIIFGKDQQ